MIKILEDTTTQQNIIVRNDFSFWNMKPQFGAAVQTCFQETTELVVIAVLLKMRYISIK